MSGVGVAFGYVDTMTAELCQQRSAQKKLFCEQFSKYQCWNDASADHRETILRRLERSCHNRAVDTCTKEFIPKLWTEPKFVSRYSCECYRILQCINEEFTKRVLSEEIDMRVICELENRILRPDASQAERDEITLRLNQQASVKYAKEACKRCGAKKVIRIETHTRAADELSSFHFKCRECNATWGN